MKMKIEIKKYILLILFFVMVLIVQAHAQTTLQQAFKGFMDEYRVHLAGISAVGLLTSFVVFTIHMIKLATLPAHPRMRRECLDNILISGICTALLGSMTLVLTLFYATIFR